MSITVLGFDYGEKRIGLAVGNSLTGTSRALGWLEQADQTQCWSKLRNLIDEWHPERLLVGIPLTLEGERQPMTRKARNFARLLREQFRIPVDEVDERLSSAAAERELAGARAAGGRNRRVKHGDTDAMAATIIVQQWLDAA